MRLPTLALAAVMTALGGSEANAVCFYHGHLYAKTTIQQEFRDSRWVVRAKVLTARDNEDGPYTTYGLLIERAFKGSPPKHLTFFTMRDSGGFYLDNGLSHDVGENTCCF